MEYEKLKECARDLREFMLDLVNQRAADRRFERFELVNDIRFVDEDGKLHDDIDVRYPGNRIELDPGGEFPIAIMVPVERKYPRDILYICLDEVSRNYGGPEEGGWWYDSGELIEYYQVLVYFVGEKPFISELETSFLNQLAYDWSKKFGAIGTSNRTSMAQDEPDYDIRVEHDKPDSWSEYQPYC